MSRWRIDCEQADRSFPRDLLGVAPERTIPPSNRLTILRKLPPPNHRDFGVDLDWLALPLSLSYLLPCALRLADWLLGCRAL